MREFKFRAWDKETKSFYYWDMRKDDPHINPFQSDGLQQFTGLKDKNGKEIYEGDIYGASFDNYRQKYEVRFIKGCFCGGILGADDNQFVPLAWRVDTDVTSIDIAECIIDEDFSFIEIIGNIFENPELKGKDNG